jgi:DNA-binding NtrC family response regulator
VKAGEGTEGGASRAKNRLADTRLKPFNTRMPRRVLILEDEVLIAQLAESMVRELGYDVAGLAHHRDTALEAIDQNDFDAALVDMLMDGKECPEIPDRLIDLRRPFAFVTGYRRAREKRHSHIQVLQKPFLLGDLRKLLETLSSM